MKNKTIEKSKGYGLNMRNFIKQLFCKHQYKSLEDLRGFFGITQCCKCSKYGQLPPEELVMTHIKFPIIKITED